MKEEDTKVEETPDVEVKMPDVEVKTAVDVVPKVTESEILQKEQDLNYIGMKEFKSLKKHRYHTEAQKHDKSFLIQNKKTKAIVEICAKTAFQACQFIGWKPKQVKLLETKDVKRDEPTDSHICGSECDHAHGAERVIVEVSKEKDA